jgi:MFS family permease
LARLRFGVVGASARVATAGGLGLLREAREGLRALAAVRGAQVVIAGSAGALFFGGLFNVAELPFATDEIGVGGTGFSALVAAFGVGFVAGSLSGSKGGSMALLRRRFILGLVLNAGGVLTCAAAPTMVVALLAFALAGIGNGMYLVHERVFLQETVPERFMARAYGAKDALASWGFGVAFLAAGALLSIVDPRELFALAGAGAMLAAVLTALMLRRSAGGAIPARADSPPPVAQDHGAYVEAPTR